MLFLILKIVLLIINIIILCNVWGVLKEINQFKISDYPMTENTIEVGGKTYNIVFGTNSVRIENSYEINNRTDRMAVLAILQGKLQERGLSDRTITSMEGEWVLHNMAYKLGEREHSADVDLDYTKDSRWYIAVLSEILGTMGI